MTVCDTQNGFLDLPAALPDFPPDLLPALPLAVKGFALVPPNGFAFAMMINSPSLDLRLWGIPVMVTVGDHDRWGGGFRPPG